MVTNRKEVQRICGITQAIALATCTITRVTLQVLINALPFSRHHKKRRKAVWIRDTYTIREGP